MAALDNCPLCLETPTRPVITSCKHIFCKNCLIQALRFKPPLYCGSCPLCRQSVSLFSTKDLETGESLQTPSTTTIWGQTYLQQGDFGVASYHFEKSMKAYISYENAPEEWLLSDGSKPPKKKYFEEASYDERTRTFRGVINWAPNTFGGDSKWTYKMVFSENFDIIEKGGILADAEEENERSRFGYELIYWKQQTYSSIFGNIYCQGDQSLGVASYHFVLSDNQKKEKREGEEGEEEVEGGGEELYGCYISYENAPDYWRLDNGHKPPMKKYFLRPKWNEEERTFEGDIEWEEGFSGCRKWVYKMIFSSDFTKIERGSVKQYGSGGEERGEGVFGEGGRLKYYVFDEGRAAAEAEVRRIREEER